MVKAVTALHAAWFLFFTLNCSSASENQPDRMAENAALDIQIGQMLKVGFRGLSIEESSHIARDIREYHAGSVVLFDYDVPTQSAERNIASPDQLRKLVADLKDLAANPLLVTVDQEGGRVARLKNRHGFPPTVSASFLGNTDHRDTTAAYAAATARTLAKMGINVNLAPVVDLNINPENPIIGGIERSFSADPEKVTRHARVFIKSHNRHGVLTTLKHFPGHGSSEADSHLGMVDVTEVWTENELVPYRRLIESGDVDMIMTAHIFNEKWDSDYPATLSKPVLTGILREDLGFDGVILSDDMQMEAIRAHYGLEKAIEMAILAGVDILGFANNSVYDEDIVPKAHGIIKNLVQEGRISEERIKESYLRIRALKSSSAL